MPPFRFGAGSFIIFFCTIAAVLEHYVFSVLGKQILPFRSSGWYFPRIGSRDESWRRRPRLFAVCVADAPAHELSVLCAILWRRVLS